MIMAEEKKTSAGNTAKTQRKKTGAAKVQQDSAGAAKTQRKKKTEPAINQETIDAAQEAVTDHVIRNMEAEKIVKKLQKHGEKFKVHLDADFLEAARTYAEEKVLIDRMRRQLDAEGLTVEKVYKTGAQPVAHPLLQEIGKHVDVANRTLGIIGSIIEKRGMKAEDETEDLAEFRL